MHSTQFHLHPPVEGITKMSPFFSFCLGRWFSARCAHYRAPPSDTTGPAHLTLGGEQSRVPPPAAGHRGALRPPPHAPPNRPVLHPQLQVPPRRTGAVVCGSSPGLAEQRLWPDRCLKRNTVWDGSIRSRVEPELSNGR